MDASPLLQAALKEWAVICKALALGQQTLLLRKGGIAEGGEGFRLQQTRFWLYPTYVHQQATGVKPSARGPHGLLEQARAEQPSEGIVRISHFADAAGVYELHDMVGALRIRDLHLWSDETVQSRFAYRRPGLTVVLLRVYRVPQPFELQETMDYRGCKSWVLLEKPLSTAGSQPVLTDAAFNETIQALDRLLKPTALA